LLLIILREEESAPDITDVGDTGSSRLIAKPDPPPAG